jgi:hypothetical protein
MKLFDNVVRSDYGRAAYSEPSFSYLNRTARKEFNKIRLVLEDWFSRYPITGQTDLWGRFRSDLDHQHQAAFFELFLYELLIRLGSQISLHPSIEGTTKTPDFLVKPQDENDFYLEATVATNESAKDLAAHARENTVYDALERLVKSPNFFLWISIKGSPNTPPPVKKLATYINDQLTNLDPDKITEHHTLLGIDGLPQWQFEHDGWKIKIRPTPKGPEARDKPGVRPIGMRSSGFHALDHRTSIRDSIVNKASKYGKLNLPYVIAVNAVDPVDTTDVMEALFGKEQYSFFISDEGDKTSEPKMTRKPDGAWNSPKGPQYTRVSAVLIVTQFSTWNIPRTNLCLYHNPWAQKKYQSVLNRLPQVVPENGEMRWLSGETPDKIFELPSSWPEDTS